ncbi:uncharacterized protein LOC127167864 isoform X12 [Labeo rohita]|uniref:uncharacterized protein LOC127167864 isoform X12 n=1 Tax=Labeo rohita TaxID=84645 RepID=UPI0021E1F0AF|nr:uncharacterized protein LOC127167864 isoform X12 [Labeo rohita]
MIGISYTSSFILILSLFLMSDSTTAQSSTLDTTTEDSTTATTLTTPTTDPVSTTTEDSTTATTLTTPTTDPVSTTTADSTTATTLTTSTTDPVSTTTADSTTATTLTTPTTDPVSTTTADSTTATSLTTPTTDPVSTTTADFTTATTLTTPTTDPVSTTTADSTTATTLTTSTTDPVSTTTADSTTATTLTTSTTDPVSTTTADSTTATSLTTPTTDPVSTTTADSTTATTLTTSTTDPVSTTTADSTTATTLTTSTTDPVSTTTADSTTATTLTTSTTDPVSTTTADSTTATSLTTPTTDPVSTTTADFTTATTLTTPTTDPVSTTTADSTTATSLTTPTTDPVSTTTAAGTTVTPDASTTGISAVTSTDPTSTTVTTGTTRTSTTTKTTVKPIKCENNGTADSSNEFCICLAGFTGRYCSNIQSEISFKEIKRTVKVAIEVNEIFKTEYANTSSKEYKEFVNRFETVIKVYNDSISAKFEVVKIILRPVNPLKKESGQRTRRSVPLEDTEKSVIVTHDMVFEMENSGSIDTTYNNLARKVQEVLSSLENNTAIDFNVSDVSKATTKLNEVCTDAEVISVDFRQYYEAVQMVDEVICVTQCHINHPKSKRCSKSGTCEVTKAGPSCFCLQTNSYWYLGTDCSLQVHKVGIYAGLGTVAAIAVLIVAIMSAYLIINKRTVKRNKDIKQELVKEWLEDDFEWPPQEKTADRYDNPVYSPREAHKQGSFKINKPEFSADRSYMQKFSPGPDINLQYLQRDPSMRMDRPRIRTSFDI